jgi:hypothetical protein
MSVAVHYLSNQVYYNFLVFPEKSGRIRAFSLGGGEGEEGGLTLGTN